ncbi:MAG: hypothetical protein RLZZ444_1165 [Pseudomonadota bacterium]
MDIVGGLYRELCDVPRWNATFGSGGRAAAAIAALSPGSILHTYVAAATESGARHLEDLGIVVRRQKADTAIAFAYFHPLSRPHLEPPRSAIAMCPPITVEGGAILRFGFVEGDAVVRGSRVVYDPQTHHEPKPFGANGSKATSLALVMNEIEIRTMTETADTAAAANRAMQTEGADVVIVKAGIRGATVFERGKAAQHVPAFRSTRVFKIGTGDVFSAIFAHHWAENGMPPHDAAILASKAVATYCETRTLPPTGNAQPPMVALSDLPPGVIEIVGAVDTIGRRWTMEEARFRLRELGLNVRAPALGDVPGDRTLVAALLVIAEGMDMSVDARTLVASPDLPVVVLHEGGGRLATTLGAACANVTITDDFVSSLYLIAWAATPQRIDTRGSPIA